MPFRVLIAGGRHFTDYRPLRATLDKLLANRLPDVELLTAGGPGVPFAAAEAREGHRCGPIHPARAIRAGISIT